MKLKKNSEKEGWLEESCGAGATHPRRRKWVMMGKGERREPDVAEWNRGM